MTVTKEVNDLIARLRAVQHGAYNAYASSVAQEAADTLAALSAQPAVAVPDGWKLVPEHVTDAMSEAAWASDGTDYVGEHHRISRFDLAYGAALAAAPQPSPQPVAVKPLEWDSVIDGGRDRVAKTVIGEYVVSVGHPNAGGTHYLWVSGQSDSDEHHSEYRTMDAAKAAAQADYERRILSALTTPPADRGENERLKVSPGVLAAHAQFGGDLQLMQKAYEWHDLKAENERLTRIAWQLPWTKKCVRLEEENGRLKRAYQGAQDNYQEAVEECSRLQTELEQVRTWVDPSVPGMTSYKDRAAAEQRVKALEEALHDLADEVFGLGLGSEPNVYADYDKLCELERLVRAALKGGEA